MSETTDQWDRLTVADLKARGSVKWALENEEALGAWVAEMDFGTAPAVIAALDASARLYEFGYPPQALVAEMNVATADFYARRHGWAIDPSQVAPIADVIKGLELAIDEFSRPGAPVIVPTPAYMPFLFVPPAMGRDVIEVPMLRSADGGYELDLAGIDAAYAAGGDLLIIANPGNPIGKVYSRDELIAVAELVDRRGGRVFSDEIHAPLTLFGNTHVPLASVSDEAARVAVTATSTSKAWNLPGLKCAQIILTNATDRKKWETIGPMASHGASTPGIRANTAAYRDGVEWLDEVVAYVEHNYVLLQSLLAEHLPLANLTPLQGTYLTWVDLSAYDAPVNIGAFLLEHARVMVNDGGAFGPAGIGFVRLNIATNPTILSEIVRRIARALA